MNVNLSNLRAVNVVLVCMVWALPSVAASNGVNNSSFELLPPAGLPFACGPGCAYNAGPVPGWTVAGAGGQFQPGVQVGNFTYFNSVPDGIRVGYSNGGSLSQTVTALVQYGMIYTLQVDQGVRKDLPDPGQVELQIGQNAPDIATGIAATPGNWSTYTAQYVGTAADVGKPISIVLASPGAQGDWDNVRLDVGPAPPPCVGECVNIFLPKPDVSATALTVVLKGDVRAQIDIAATADNATVNPFAYVDKNLFGGVNTSTVSVTLDGDGNTDLTFTAGLHPILNSYSFDYGTATNGKPHYGYEGIGASFNVLSQTWTDLNVGTALPTSSASCPAANGPATQFALLFAEVTQNGQTTGQWTECAVDSSSPSWLLDNPTAGSEMLSNIGYFLSPTQIPLDLLNLSGTPPPDVPGSPFIALTQFDGQALNGGGSISINASVPEPSSLLLLVGGLLVLVGCRPLSLLTHSTQNPAGISRAKTSSLTAFRCGR